MNFFSFFFLEELADELKLVVFFLSHLGHGELHYILFPSTKEGMLITRGLKF